MTDRSDSGETFVDLEAGSGTREQARVPRPSGRPKVLIDDFAVRAKGVYDIAPDTF